MAFRLQIFVLGTPAMDEFQYHLYVLSMEQEGYF